MNYFSFLLFVQIVAASNIWMNIDVKKIDRKQCIVDETSWGAETAGCQQMSYMTIDERILPNHERRSTSFEHISGSSRPTVTHWPRGKLSDWMLSIQFISVDPVYGIARTCDRSGYVRVFENVTEDVQFVDKIVKIQGQCFTATVQVQASLDICPWCIEESASTETTTTTTQKPINNQMETQFLMISMLFLSIICVCALIGVAVLLILYITDRKGISKSSTTSSNLSLPIYQLPQPTVSRCGSFAGKAGILAAFPNDSTLLNWKEYNVEEQWISQRVYSECSSPDSGTDTL
ncbi:unnamed protein product [Caenorhabditis angaria]|uniref:C2 domain-containing protein n=1 Tax=Caenorhabditis angaria TaxID=860376 RepID=A0A9P1MZ19_9PELO|nr:unnamed protein product [Caenorhabditis angaria]